MTAMEIKQTDSVNVFRLKYDEIKEIFNKLYLPDLKDIGCENKIINKIIQNWDTTFHLYTHNCQHFGKYMIEKLKKNSIE